MSGLGEWLQDSYSHTHWEPEHTQPHTDIDSMALQRYQEHAIAAS